MNIFTENSIFSLPSVTIAELLWQICVFLFFFFFNNVFENDEAEWSKCLETYGELLVWSFDLWDWKVLHKEQTLSTVVLFVISNP